jgi:hypothetical protein
LGKDPQHNLPEELTLRLLINPSLLQESEVVRHDQMASYHWTLIGKAFARLFPGRSLELADTMLEYFGREGTILGGYRSETHSVLVEILQRHPEETWKRIAEHLGPPIDHRAYLTKDWLRGEDLWDKKEEGALSLIPTEAVWRWVDEDIEKRAWYLASFVPNLLFREEGRNCWAREVLIRYGKREDVRRNLMSNFSSEGWWGPTSVHLQNKVQALLDFGEEEENENVRRWINEYVSYLEQDIERARIEEERRDF